MGDNRYKPTMPDVRAMAMVIQGFPIRTAPYARRRLKEHNICNWLVHSQTVAKLESLGFIESRWVEDENVEKWTATSKGQLLFSAIVPKYLERGSHPPVDLNSSEFWEDCYEQIKSRAKKDLRDMQLDLNLLLSELETEES